jgi:hypothetical protein
LDKQRQAQSTTNCYAPFNIERFTTALPEAAGATLDDIEFVALILFSDGGSGTRGVGGWCAGEDGGSVARRVASALPGILSEVGAVKLKIQAGS